MSEKKAAVQPQSRARLYVTTLLQVFIVLCLVDGVLDISYALARFAKKKLGPTISEIATSGTRGAGKSLGAIPPSGLPSRDVPGIQNIVAEHYSPGISVTAEGQRLNGQEIPAKSQEFGLLLGSSTAFGYGIADNETIAAHLERKLNIRILNYAGVAQPVPDNMLRWYAFQNKAEAPSFVILAGVSYQLYKDCYPDPEAGSEEKVHSSAFLFVARKILGMLRDKAGTKLVTPCDSQENSDLAIRRSLLAVENAVAFAHKYEIPFYIVNLPTPYGANVNIDNLVSGKQSNAYVPAMQRVFGQYDRELAKLDLPEFIDLSNALPTDQPYFLDAGGHLSAEGSRLVSEQIFERIWGEKGRLGAGGVQHTLRAGSRN